MRLGTYAWNVIDSERFPLGRLIEELSAPGNTPFLAPALRGRRLHVTHPAYYLQIATIWDGAEPWSVFSVRSYSEDA
ncbi:hypothetical protein NMY22_g17938 [Coprinellus aureogranulatus]|nr:hypothetical protein NMY22_g17938 [Coprinellus aureogranulatus]